MATPEPGTVGEAVAALTAWVERLMPAPERAEALCAALRTRFGNDDRDVTPDALVQIEQAGHPHCRHLALEYAPGGDLVPDAEPPGWPAADPLVSARRAAAVTSVVRRGDGVGILRLDALDLASPYLEASFALLRGAIGVVVDLRHNRGGEPATLALAMSWLLEGEQRHYADVVGSDGTRQWWTSGRGGGLLPRSTPVTVAVSERTFSSAEGLAFFVQRAGRGLVVGQGAADDITPVVLTRSVRAFVPEAYYVDAETGTNWEGVGVVPDVACEEGATIETAARLLADSLRFSALSCDWR